MSTPESYRYIEQSRRIISSIDPEELAAMEVQKLVGSSDHLITPNTLTYAIGDMEIDGSQVPLAVKIDPGNRYRLQSELSAISEIVNRAPELLPKLPLFLGGIAVLGSEINYDAVLTEDATDGGRLQIRPAITTDTTLRILDKAFMEEGELFNVFDRDMLTRSTAFKVGGKERLLDFHPNPIRFDYRLSQQESLHDLGGAARTAAEELTISIPADSNLGNSLQEIM